MKTSLLNFVAFILFGAVLPLSGKPHLISNHKVIILSLLIALLIFSQPVFRIKNGIEKINQDKGSMQRILVSSFLVLIITVVDWGYGEERSKSLLLDIVGIVMMILGVIYRIWSIRTLGRFFSTQIEFKENHQLITTGPYKYLRHPSYTGAFVVFIGTTIFFGSMIGLLTAIFFMGYAYKKRIEVEESLLLHLFGPAYRAYLVHTYKLIPFIW